MDTDARAPDPATLQQALTQLEQAIRDHAEWHENLLRAVVCGLSRYFSRAGPAGFQPFSSMNAISLA